MYAVIFAVRRPLSPHITTHPFFFEAEVEMHAAASSQAVIDWAAGLPHYETSRWKYEKIVGHPYPHRIMQQGQAKGWFTIHSFRLSNKGRIIHMVRCSQYVSNNLKKFCKHIKSSL